MYVEIKVPKFFKQILFFTLLLPLGSVLAQEFKEEEKLLNLRAVIHVARDSQKGIIIGHQGKALKRVGTEARKDMEEFFQKKVFLQIFVKVTKDWRDKDNALGRFGYDFQ